MKKGKVPENVLKRSILKKTGKERKEVLTGAKVGGDCACLQFTGATCVSVKTCFKDDLDTGVVLAANNIYAAGAEPVGVLIALTLPINADEDVVKDCMGKIDTSCKELNLQIVGGHTEFTEAVNEPVVSVTVMGQLKTDKPITSQGAKPGDDVIVTKWIGLEGIVKIVKKYEADLLKKFPSKMIYDAKNFSKILSVESEAAPAVKSGVTAMHDISGGGVFSALWELAESSGVGLEIELKKIPVKQETIEICNFFDLNPYELCSGGSLLITASDGNKLVLDLKKEGIEACVIGKCTKGNERVVVNGDIRRFLEPSRNDEIYKV